MSSTKRRAFLFVSLLAASLAMFMAASVSRANAQESTPTPEPEEIPLVPTPMAPPEDPPMQAMAQTQQSSTPSDDRIIDKEPDSSILPVLAYSAEEGVYLAVWQDTLDFAPTNIFGRYVDAQGNPLGTRFLVAGPRPGRVQVKVVAGGGVFSVLWQEGPDQFRASLYVQRVDGSLSGSPLLGAPLLVHTPVEDQFQAVFNPDRNEFLMVWLDPRNAVLASYLRGEVYGRRMTPGGVLDPTEVNFTPAPANPSLNDILNAASAENDLSAAYNPDLAQYLLTYGTYYCTNLNCLIREEVRARRLDAGSLARIGNPIFVTPNPNRIQWAARALYNPRLQQYVVFWNDNRTLESDMTIYAQRISALGSLVGTNQMLISESGSQLWPEAAYLDGDAPLPRYFLAWEDDPGTHPHFAQGAFFLDSLGIDGRILDLSREGDSSQQAPVPTSDHQPLPNIVAVWQHTRPSQGADVHAAFLSSLAQYATVSVLDEDGTTVLPWNGLADTSVFIEASLPELMADRPDSLTAVITAHQSGQRSFVSLPYAGEEGGRYVYRSLRLDAAQLVQQPTEMTVAAVVNAQVEFEYTVATDFMDNLGIPSERRRGIAWGTGDEGLQRAPASEEFFKAAGFEDGSLALVGFTATDEFFLKNQADVLLYIGEGYHDEGTGYLANTIRGQAGAVSVGPEEIRDLWDGVEVAVLFGCSVLDINNYNGWATDPKSPGKDWAQLVPGPETWLGFQWKAPSIGPPPGQGSERFLEALAGQVTLGETWLKAWEKTTDGHFPWAENDPPLSAVAIDRCSYYYWWVFSIAEHAIYKEWRRVPCDQWNSSSAGLEVVIASPVQVHIYDDRGGHVGWNPSIGGVETTIPGSSYWNTELVSQDGLHNAERISIIPADLSAAYDVSLIGKEEGTFDLILEIPDRAGGLTYEVGYIDVPVTSGATYDLDLGPAAETDFALVTFEGERILPTSIATRSLDLPVHVELSGTLLDFGWYADRATATLSSSTRPDLPQVTAFEYDLGEGWQPYETPVVLDRYGENLFRYRGLFADGSYDVTQEIVVRVLGANQPPVADAGPDQTVQEGDVVVLSAEASTDPDADALTYSWELVSATGPVVVLSSSSQVSPSIQSLDDATYLFRVTVDDGRGGRGSDETTITVENAPPALSPISLPAGPAPVGATIGAGSDFSDRGTLDTHDATWEWGDGTTSEAMVTETGGTGTVSGAHTYVSPGVYTVRLTLADDDNATVSAEYEYLVIYDPTGGFVTAGGWFQSRPGSYSRDPLFNGKSHFGLNARYQDGASVPRGQAQFSLQGEDLNFHIVSYEWLVVANRRAQLKGTGTINGEAGYSLLVTLVDSGNSDMVRVKIWHSATGEVLYDSQPGEPDDADASTALGGGSVVVHD